MSDISDCDSDSVITAHDINELYNKVMMFEKELEKEKKRVDEEIEGLHERADIGITERAKCLRDIAKIRIEKLDEIERVSWYILSTKRQYKMVKCVIAITAVHGVWCLSKIARNIIKARA
jgi:hypothetical protein